MKKTNSSRKDLFYQFAPILIQNIPRQLVQELIRQGKYLNPTKLLPALLMCNDNPTAGLEAIEYLEFCVYKLQCTDQALHNYLLALYAKQKPKQLKQYLAAQGNFLKNFSFKRLNTWSLQWLIKKLICRTRRFRRQLRHSLRFTIMSGTRSDRSMRSTISAFGLVGIRCGFGIDRQR